MKPWPELWNVAGDTRVAILDRAYDVVVTDQLLDANGGQETLAFSMRRNDPKAAYVQGEMLIRVSSNAVTGVGRVDSIFAVRRVVDGYDNTGRKSWQVYAEGRWYELGLADAIIVDPTGNPTTALTQILAGTGWTVGTVSITAPSGVSYAQPTRITPLAAIRAMPGVFGGEVVFDNVNRTVSLVPSRGNPNTGIMYAHGASMQANTRTIDTTQLTTRVRPVGANGIDIGNVNGGVYYVEDYSYFDNQTPPAPRQVRAQLLTNDQIGDATALMAWGRAQLATLSKPKVTYDITVAVLGQNIAIPQVGDTVRVWDKELGLNTNARVAQRALNLIEPWKTTLQIDTAAYQLSNAFGTPGTPGTAPAGTTPTADTTMPTPPTNIVLTAVSGIDENGNSSEEVQIGWTAPAVNTDGTTITDIDHYNVRYILQAPPGPTDPTKWVHLGEVTELGTSTGAIAPTPSPIIVQVRTVDTFGHLSTWAEADGTVPRPGQMIGTPSAPVLDAATLPLTIRATWDGLEADEVTSEPVGLRWVEVHLSTDNFAANDTQVGTMAAAGTFPITGLTAGTTYYVRFVAVDVVGNKTPPSVIASATALPVGPAKIAYAGDWGNKVPDGSFETAANRARILNGQTTVIQPTSGSTPFYFVTAPADNGANAMQGAGGFGGGTLRTVTLVSGIAIQRGAKLWFKGRIRGDSANGTASIQVVTKDANGATVNTYTASTTTSNGTFVTASGTAGGVAGFGATEVTITVLAVMGADVTAGTWTFDGVEVRDIIQTAIVDNAAITDAQIGSVAAGKITAGILSADVTMSKFITTSAARDVNGNPTGARLDINSTGVHLFNSTGTEVGTMALVNGNPTVSMTGGSIVGGSIRGTSVRTTSSVATNGASVELASDSGLIYLWNGFSANPGFIQAANNQNTLVIQGPGASTSQASYVINPGSHSWATATGTVAQYLMNSSGHTFTGDLWIQNYAIHNSTIVAPTINSGGSWTGAPTIGSPTINASTLAQSATVTGTLLFSPVPAGGAGTTANVGTGGAFHVGTSSRRFKQDIKGIDVTLDDLMDLRPVQFRYRNDVKEQGDKAHTVWGLIAEDVAEIPHLAPLVLHDADDKPWSVQYEGVTIALLSAAQKLHRETADLRGRVEALEAAR